MGVRRILIAVLVTTAGTLPAACGIDPHETSDERRYVNICTQYIGQKYDNAEALCRCQWKGIRKEVPKENMDEFFFKLTAGRRFETKASRMIDRISSECQAKLGGKE